MRTSLEALTRIEGALTAHLGELQEHVGLFDERARDQGGGGGGIRETQPKRSMRADPQQAQAQRDVLRANRTVEEARVACFAAIDAAQQRMSSCNSVKAAVESANYARKAEHAPHPRGCPKRALYDSWSSDVTFGLEWEDVGTLRPETGQPLVNAKLVAKLKGGQTSFRREDLLEFGVASTLRRHHFVKVDGSYFRPACASAWEERASMGEEAARALLEGWQGPPVEEGVSSLATRAPPRRTAGAYRATLARTPASPPRQALTVVALDAEMLPVRADGSR